MPEEMTSHVPPSAEVGPGEQILPVSRAVRRRRRQTLTFLVIVALVLTVGLAGLTYYYGMWTWPGSPAEPSACPTPGPTAVTHDQVTMNVYNASDRRGLAASVAKQLEKRKFTVSEIDNDPLRENFKNPAVVRHGSAGLLAARTVAAQVKGTVKLEPDDRTNDSVDLVLGEKYAGLRSVKDAAKKLAASAGPTPSPVPGCAP